MERKHSSEIGQVWDILHFTMYVVRVEYHTVLYSNDVLKSKFHVANEVVFACEYNISSAIWE